MAAVTGTSQVVILDAQDLAAGPVAVLGLRRPLPSGLHGCWSEQYFGPREESRL